MKTEIFLKDEFATLSLGKTIAEKVPNELVIFLCGDLGAGKTTFVRGFLQALGHNGNVKSPTYTLVEPYEINRKKFFHFDLYRLSHPEELEYIGARDYFTNAVSLIEWPERGEGFLPYPDLVLKFVVKDSGRNVFLETFSRAGEATIK